MLPTPLTNSFLLARSWGEKVTSIDGDTHINLVHILFSPFIQGSDSDSDLNRSHDCALEENESCGAGQTPQSVRSCKPLASLKLFLL